jgi:hypothetical protein
VAGRRLLQLLGGVRGDRDQGQAGVHVGDRRGMELHRPGQVPADRLRGSPVRLEPPREPEMQPGAVESSQ